MGFAVAEDHEFAPLPLNERPLVTFALFSYNQEKYIREAVEGAFAQTYEPLEIILSDDCSTDRTFEIMEEMAAGYKGRHVLRLNRNNENMGISTHVRFVDEIAKGEIIVHAAGDDISIPCRTSHLVKAFRHDPDVFYVTSNAIKITHDGKTKGLLCRGADRVIRDKPTSIFEIGLPGINGCASAVRKSLIASFPPPCSSIWVEDIVLLRRAYLVGYAKYIPQSLVKYRTGVGVSNKNKLSFKEAATRLIRYKNDELIRLKQLAEDMEHIGCVGDVLTQQDLHVHIQKTILTKRAIEKTGIKDVLLVVKLYGARELLKMAKYFMKSYFNF